MVMAAGKYVNIKIWLFQKSGIPLPTPVTIPENADNFM